MKADTTESLGGFYQAELWVADETGAPTKLLGDVLVPPFISEGSEVTDEQAGVDTYLVIGFSFSYHLGHFGNGMPLVRVIVRRADPNETGRGAITVRRFPSRRR